MILNLFLTVISGGDYEVDNLFGCIVIAIDWMMVLLWDVINIQDGNDVSVI